MEHLHLQELVPFPYAKDKIIVMDIQEMGSFPYAKDVIIMMD